MLYYHEIYGFIEKSNGNKYLTIVLSDENKNTLESMKNYGTKSEILLD